MSRLDAWRSRLWLWLPPLVFLTLNLIFVSAYRLVFQGRQILLENRIEQTEETLTGLDQRGADLLGQLESAILNRQRIDRLYNDILGIESERLTRVIAEVQSLENRVGLRPRSTSYPEDRIEDFGLVSKAVVFGVEGSYIQLRQFINLLELSDSFLILEEVGLSNTGGANRQLRIRLRLVTYFVDPDDLAAATGNRQSSGRRLPRDG